jgi:hypothetical protein
MTASLLNPVGGVDLRLDLDEIVSTMMSEIRSGVIASEEDYIEDFEDFYDEKNGQKAPQSILWDPMASKDFRTWLRSRLRSDAVEWYEGLSSMADNGTVWAGESLEQG